MPSYFFRTISSANTSARIATPSSRNSGRLTAPVIWRRRARLPADRLRRAGGQLADAESRANDHQPEPDARAHERNRITFHYRSPL